MLNGIEESSTNGGENYSEKDNDANDANAKNFSEPSSWQSEDLCKHPFLKIALIAQSPIISFHYQPDKRSYGRKSNQMVRKSTKMMEVVSKPQIQLIGKVLFVKLSFFR